LRTIAVDTSDIMSRELCAILVAITAWLGAGCQTPAAPAAPTTMPHRPTTAAAVDFSSEAPADKLKNDLGTLAAIFHDGLLTKEEYQRIREAAIFRFTQSTRGIEAYVPVGNNSWITPYTTTEVSGELRRLNRMKSDGILNDAEYETARAAVVARYVPTTEPAAK
jgi:hypothetical protein